MPTMRVWREMFERGELNAVQARYFGEKPIEELYDVEADPRQIKNSATDPAFEGILKEMLAACVAEMRATRDLGLLPEYELHRRAEGRTPYDVGLDPELNPLDDLLSAVDLVNERSVENIPALLEGLQHPTPFIRLRAVNVIDRLAQVDGWRSDVAAWAVPAFPEAIMNKSTIVLANFLNQILNYLPRQWEAAEAVE